MVFVYIYFEMLRFFIFSVLVALMVAPVGCRHDNNKHVSPVSDPYLNLVDKLEGTWEFEGIGQTQDMYYEALFFPQSIHVISSKLIMVGNDTLPLVQDGSTMIFYHYIHNGGGATSGSIDQVTYDYTTNNLFFYFSYGYSLGSGSFKLSRVLHKNNFNVKNHISSIRGVKAMAGIVFDTLWRPGIGGADTEYSINKSITFSFIDDSTISFSDGIFQMNDNSLHYKGSDPSKNIDTFQSYQSFGPSAYPQFSTLLYYAIGDSLIFEQRYHAQGIGGHARLR